ncbi:MAG: hypothetical protein ACXVBY_21670, partial [Isosphaeraceae bacterium]
MGVGQGRAVGFAIERRGQRGARFRRRGLYPGCLWFGSLQGRGGGQCRRRLAGSPIVGAFGAKNWSAPAGWDRSQRS